MTVSYTHLSHTAGWIGGITRLLFIWKGSLFKQIWPDFTLFFGLYACLSLFYRLILVDYEDRKIQYELFCVYCERFSRVIPISFLLGFYVTQVVSRWWAQFMSLPWPDTLARYLAVYLPGTDEVSRNYRRTVCRWVNLGNVMALRLVSYKVMVRFPSLEHLVASGLATSREMLQIKKLSELIQNRHQISFYPNMWAQNLLRKARKEGLIINDWFAHVLIKEVDNMANMNGMLICYGWINIPLVYTQVVTLAVYAYFVACLFGRQYLLPTQYRVQGGVYVPVGKFPSVSNWTGTLTPGASNVVGYDNEVADFIIPVFTILEYLFYMGWLKVAETLLNPFGEDDDDFDTYYLIDRNLQMAYVMVDEAGVSIELEQDPFQGSLAPELRHTNMSAKILASRSEDERPHFPTEGLCLTREQASLATPVKGSQTLAAGVGSQLNLAATYLALPVSELSRSRQELAESGGQTPRPYNMAARILNRRPSRLNYVQEVDISEENGSTELQVTPSSPGTSRNEQMLFGVPKKSAPSPPPRLLAAGLLADGCLESGHGGLGQGMEGVEDGDVFDGDGW